MSPTSSICRNTTATSISVDLHLLSFLLERVKLANKHKLMASPYTKKNATPHFGP